MNKLFQIRNSNADFLIFAQQNGEFSESEFYRIIQDKNCQSDFDKLVAQTQNLLGN